jgi:hypothetical protein
MEESNIPEIFSSIFESLEQMYREKTIDYSILPYIDRLIEKFDEFEKFWITSQDVAIQTAFVMYLSARNSRMILQKMKEKFEIAKQEASNPKVVGDSRKVIFPIYGIYESLLAAQNSLPNVDFSLPSQLIEQIRILRVTAKNVGMLPTLKEEMAGINKKRLRREFSDLDVRLLVETLV